MKDDRGSHRNSQVGLHRPAGPGAGHQEERAPVAAGRLQDVVAGAERGQQDGLRAVQLRGAEEQPQEGLAREEPQGHAGPVTSPCLSKHQGRTSISRCSSWTMSTASGSGASTPWTSWWSTTRRRLSSPASTGRGSTSSERCRDAARCPALPEPGRAPRKKPASRALLPAGAPGFFLHHSLHLVSLLSGWVCFSAPFAVPGPPQPALEARRGPGSHLFLLHGNSLSLWTALTPAGPPSGPGHGSNAPKLP
uniref:NCK adaptor protein 2 n=1 Tax=Catagonus wagneri TaxID=51154 RepID=A0A8C3VRU7_9CETA